MTTAGHEEYVTDVPYMRGFTGDLSPVMIRLVAALNGFAPDPRASDDFDYCELGSAHGDTTATLAAAYGRARFVGVDLNPDHIASANRLASEGGLTNVRFLGRDFEDLTPGDVPPLDFLTAHGVLSWVGPAKRKAMLDFATARLKHGGLFYVSYNALPGWAAVEPLRQLMMERGAAVGGSSVERARAGFALAKTLSDAGAAYFTNNPATREMLARMEQFGLPYIVHEYMHAHWVPMYFAQVAAEMAAHDLYFVGQLPLHLNYRDLAIPASLASLFKGVPDRITFETLKDYATNEFFRRDIFVKGKVLRDEVAANGWLASVPFGTLLGNGPLMRNVRLPHHTLHFIGEVFDALLPALAEGATTVQALAGRPELAGFGVARIRDAIMRLAVAAQVSPMQAPTHASIAVAAGALRVPSAYNRMILRERLSSEHPIVLASAVAGNGVAVPMLDGIVLRLLTEIPEPEWRGWIAAFAARQPFRVKVREQEVEGEEERFRVLLGQVEEFRRTRIPKLIELGIVARVPSVRQ
jgi:SAM-dependent methyltransferase